MTSRANRDSGRTPERVLVPMDDSPHSWEALAYALEKYPDARLMVLHVLDPAAPIALGHGLGPAVEEHLEGRRETAEAFLEQAATRADEAGVTAEIDLTTGRPAHGIAEYVREHAIDHVVLGSHGRTGVTRLLLGSVAEDVLRRVACSVTIVR